MPLYVIFIIKDALYINTTYLPVNQRAFGILAANV